MTNTCAICGRPTPDGYVDMPCCNRAAGHLAAIIELTPDARLVAAGLVRRGGGGGGGKPGPQSPLNDGATDTVLGVETRLTRWARQIAAERGIPPPWVTTYGDPITAVSGFLSAQCEWVRHRGPTTDPAWLTAIYGPPPWDTDPADPPLIVVELFAAISRSATELRFTVNGPNEQKYLGPCGALVGCCDLHGRHCEPPSELCCVDCTEVAHPEHWPGARCTLLTPPEAAICDGDIYGIRGGQNGRCRTCGAEVAQDDRQAWLDGEVRAHAFTAAQIADAYGINVKTIRSWATDRAESRDHRGTLTRSATPARLRTHAIGRDGQALFLVGDVLDLAAADAARRETERAKRERRAADRVADRVADGERMSA